jgi:hypothetical protein
MKTLMTIMLLAVFGAACGGGGQVVKETPKPGPVAAEEKELSPDRQAYVDCYKELACRVNLDYDPLDDYATIHEPIAQIRMMVENDDNRLKYYLPILQRHGYPTAQALLDKDQWFKEAIPVWWEKQRGGLLNIMGECKKK